MKALTVQQPYATLIAIGAKRIETRSWRTNFRGPLAIHAAKAFPGSAMDLCYGSPYMDDLMSGFESHRELPRGAVIAICRLVACHPMCPDEGLGYKADGEVVEVSLDEHEYGDYSAGRWAWVLEDVQKLAQPIPAKGALGLWEWPAS